MKRRQRPKDKITQVDTIKSVRRMISKPTQVHYTKKEKHKFDWRDELDELSSIDLLDGDEFEKMVGGTEQEALSHKPGDYE